MSRGEGHHGLLRITPPHQCDITGRAAAGSIHRRDANGVDTAVAAKRADVGARATRDFLAKVNRESPETTILVDEAYFDYVTNPDHDTHIGSAVDTPHVVVARTLP